MPIRALLPENPEIEINGDKFGRLIVC